MLDKEHAADGTGIFMIDASRGFIKDKDKNRLREQDIYKIVTAFGTMHEIKGFSRFVPDDEIVVKNAYNLNIPRYISSGEKEDQQSIAAHLYGGIPQDDIDSIPEFWDVFPDLKKKLFKKYAKGFLKLAVDRDAVHAAICGNAEFAEYNDTVTKTFEDWKVFSEPKLTKLKRTDSNKKLIGQLSEKLVELYEPVVLLDKYDVYQVLLAYWNETMNDDVLLIIQDEKGYGVARETEDITEEIKNGKNKGKYKVVGWEGKLIPQKLVRDVFFGEEVSEIAAKENEVAQKEADRDEFVENNSDDDGYLGDYADDDKKIDDKEVESRVKQLKKQNDKPDSAEYNVLSTYVAYTNDIKNLNREISARKKKLDEKCRERYSKFTEQEIKDLLVHKKWYASLQDGIQNLYVTAANNLSKRIVELAERYENTLTELTQQEHDLECKVTAHLKEMGFTYE